MCAGPLGADGPWRRRMCSPTPMGPPSGSSSSGRGGGECGGGERSEQRGTLGAGTGRACRRCSMPPLVLVLAVGARRVGHAREAAVGVGVLLLVVVVVREEGDGDKVREREEDEGGEDGDEG
jgi:hypothetical protein